MYQTARTIEGETNHGYFVYHQPQGRPTPEVRLVKAIADELGYQPLDAVPAGHLPGDGGSVAGVYVKEKEPLYC